MNFTNFKIIFPTFLLLSLSGIAHAKDNNKIIFDYSSMSLSSIGIYNPKLEGEKSGLKAELNARKNGIDNLVKYMNNSCDGVDKSALSLRSDWDSGFHSQGTEIFSNGVLAITLQAPLKQIFKTSSRSRKVIKTDEGEKIVFQLPPVIPLSAIRCGTIELDLGDKNKIHIIPLDSIENTTNNIQIIHLVFNAKNSNLELDPAFKVKESQILENSTLADIENISSEVLPIAVAIDAAG